MFLTFKQADKICLDYRYLIGNQIKNGWRAIGTVKELAVVPFDDFNKYRFIKQYKECLNAETSRQFYEGELFDVLLIGASLRNPSEFIIRDLRKYLEEQEISFNYDFYVSRTLLMQES